jgi:UBX domain-containing protein 6
LRTKSRTFLRRKRLKRSLSSLGRGESNSKFYFTTSLIFYNVSNYRLTDSAPSSSSSSKKPQDVYVPIKRDDLSNEAKMARNAALARVTSNADKPLNFSLKAIKEQAKKELEDEKKLGAQTSFKNLSLDENKKEEYTVDGVFFGCPLVSDEILPKKEWKGKIKEFLYEQMVADPGLTACLIIKNCNVLDRAEDCIETIKKYLNNIVANPSEEKFHKIRTSNRIFSEKVANVEGAFEFMQAAGFSEQIMDDGEKYLVWSPDFPIEMLTQLHEALGV